MDFAFNIAFALQEEDVLAPLKFYYNGNLCYMTNEIFYQLYIFSGFLTM